jgi:hypothetical protein
MRSLIKKKKKKTYWQFWPLVYTRRGEDALSKPGPFRYTLRDTILSENLLNIFSIFFALNLLQQVGQDGMGCQGSYESGRPEWIGALKSALGWKIIGGCLSAFVLAGQLVECLGTRNRRRQRQGNGGTRRDRSNNVDDRLGKLVFFTSLVITFVNFITSWEIWGSESIALGLSTISEILIADSFCSLCQCRRNNLLSWECCWNWG